MVRWQALNSESWAWRIPRCPLNEGCCVEGSWQTEKRDVRNSYQHKFFFHRLHKLELGKFDDIDEAMTFPNGCTLEYFSCESTC